MSDQNTTENKTLFDELGLEVKLGEVEIGQTYPIFGIITKFINDTLGCVVIEINQNIEAKLDLDDQEKLNLLKNRAFDTGIFVCKIKETGAIIKAECSTIIFGKTTEQVQ